MISNQDQNNEESIDTENISSEEITIDEQSIDNEYQFGWNNYSERINGRFAMLGFIAIILIELFSQKSFLNWTGLF